MEKEWKSIVYADRSQFLDLEISDRRIHALLPKIFPSTKNKNVLIVPYGPGSLDSWLSACESYVQIVDIEPAILAFAEKRHVAAKIPNIEYEIGDITSLPIGRKFDLIIIPNEALQLFSHSTIYQILNCMSKILERDGSLIVDTARFKKGTVKKQDTPGYYSPKQADNVFVTEWRKDRPPISIERRRRQLHRRNGVHIDFKYHVHSGDREENLQFSTALFNLRVRDMMRLARSSNLKIEAVFGDYSGRPATNKSPRLIYVIKK